MLPLISITGQQKQTETTYCQAEKDNHAADVPSASPLSSSGQPQSFNGPNESAIRPLSQRHHTDFTPKIFVSVHSETLCSRFTHTLSLLRSDCREPEGRLSSRSPSTRECSKPQELCLKPKDVTFKIKCIHSLWKSTFSV